MIDDFWWESMSVLPRLLVLHTLSLPNHDLTLRYCFYSPIILAECSGLQPVSMHLGRACVHHIGVTCHFLTVKPFFKSYITFCIYAIPQIGVALAFTNNRGSFFLKTKVACMKLININLVTMTVLMLSANGTWPAPTPTPKN